MACLADDFYWDFGYFKIINTHYAYKAHPTAKHINCHIDDVDLGSQKVHQNKLAAKLAPYGITLTHVKGTLWSMPTKKGYPVKPNRHLFVVSTSNPDLFWYRYDNDHGGSSSHTIKYKKWNLTLNQFLDRTDDEVRAFLNLEN
jgi:hypothetical protein